MGDLKSLLERGLRGFEPSDDAFERTLRRRNRKRRNQRIAAGVVGVAVFVAAIWVVTSGVPFRNTGTPAITGPAETGPTVAPDTGPNGSNRIPPEGVAVSTPVVGKLIAEANVPFNGYVRVYADGRVLSVEAPGGHFVERRLSPKGVELVRSGALDPAAFVAVSQHIPANAWEDREGKPYVPARYAACFRHIDPPPVDEAVLDLLPASAQALLRGSDAWAWNPECLELTPAAARSLVDIMGSSRGDPAVGDGAVGRWLLRGGLAGDRVTMSLHPLFPDGRRFFRLSG